MKGFLNSRRASSMLSALCFIALGVFLVGWPDLSRIWICRSLGAALLVTGGVYVLFHFVRAKGATVVFQYDLILGVVLAIAGVWLLTTPDLIVTFIQYILGVILVVHGVLDLQGAWNLRTARFGGWWIAALIGLLTAALGALILWNPLAGVDGLLILVGLALIYDGASDLVILLQLTHAYPKTKEDVPEIPEEIIEVGGEIVPGASAESESTGGNAGENKSENGEEAQP